MESKINVTVRMKPLSSKELQNTRNKDLWQKIADNTILNTRTKEVFAFDNVFSPEVTTSEIFVSQIKPIVSQALSGINQTVFAYGQTSSGKTFTMRGYTGDKNADIDPLQKTGLITLSVQQIFDHIKNDKDNKYTVSVSYLELYNECINDLIVPANKNLEIRESITQGIYVNRLSVNDVNTAEEALDLMIKGDDARIMAETKMNESSSRSHTVFRVNIQSKPVSSSSSMMKMSQLNLVDLAGSEGATKTQAEGIRLREGSNINRSLLALSNVINKLSSSSGSKAQFINYRDSKLTRILQKSLGGNSNTAIICTMTQTVGCYQETTNTLHFGQKAKHVKTTVNVNQIDALSNNSDLEKANKLIKELKANISALEEKIQSQTLNGGKAVAQDQDVEMAGDKNDGTHRSNENVSVMALKEQIKFISEKLKRVQDELDEREQQLGNLEHERREWQTKCAKQEGANSRQTELLQLERQKAQTLAAKNDLLAKEFNRILSNYTGKDKENPQFKQQYQLLQECCIAMNQDQNQLEADGFKLIDLSKVAASSDLRMSIEPSSSATQNQRNETLEDPAGEKDQHNQSMSNMLESMTIERDQLRRKMQDIQIQHLNQTLEANLDAKEEREALLSENLRQSEQIQQLEKRQESLTSELQFYKDQNSDLLTKLEEFDMQLDHHLIQQEIKEAQDCKDNQSMLQELNNSFQKQTQCIKTKATFHEQTISQLKDEIKLHVEQREKTQQKCSDLEFALRAAECNVEILKTQLDNHNTEQMLMKNQITKHQKQVTVLKQVTSQLKHDISYYKKGKRPPPPQSNPFRAAAAAGSGSGSQSLNESFMSGLEMSSQSLRLSVSPSEIGSTTPFLIDTKCAEIQTDMGATEIQQLERDMENMRVNKEESQVKINELESMVGKSNAKHHQNEQLKKLKFDNQVLMQRLGEYKKAEKGARDLCNDYEQMKLKYFNVLTENERQKTQIAEQIGEVIQKEQQVKSLQKERDRIRVELDNVMTELKNKAQDSDTMNLLQKMQQQFTQSQKDLTAEVVLKNNQISQLLQNTQYYLEMLEQISKHLKTLVKYLKDIVNKSEDPVAIEQTQRQIKSIERLSTDVKKAMRQSKKIQQLDDKDNNNECNQVGSNNETSMFNMSQSSCKSKERSSIGSSEGNFKVPAVPTSSDTNTHKQQSADIYVEIPNLKRKKTDNGDQSLNASSAIDVPTTDRSEVAQPIPVAGGRRTNKRNAKELAIAEKASSNGKGQAQGLVNRRSLVPRNSVGATLSDSE